MLASLFRFFLENVSSCNCFLDNDTKVGMYLNNNDEKMNLLLVVFFVKICVLLLHSQLWHFFTSLSMTFLLILEEIFTLTRVHSKNCSYNYQQPTNFLFGPSPFKYSDGLNQGLNIQIKSSNLLSNFVTETAIIL